MPIGVRKFAIWPADARGGGDLEVTGIQEPIPLALPTDTVTWPNEVTSAFDSLAVHTLVLKEGGEIFKAASVQYQEFIRINKRVSIWQGMRWPAWYVPEGQQKK
jgi:hypothetical protein